MEISSSFPALPFDIIEIIVDELAKDGCMLAIKACCLASILFVPLCRKHIFFRLKVWSSDRNDRRPANWFKILLERDPSIAGSVRDLDLTNHYRAQRHLGTRILQDLRRVHSFTLGFTDPRHCCLPQRHWEMLPKAFTNSIIHFIRQNDIVTLKLSHIKAVPVSLFKNFPSLENLELFNLQVAEDGSTTIKAQTPSLLRRLCVENGCTETLDTILRIGGTQGGPLWNLTGLRELSVWMEEPQSAEITNHILSLTNALEVLTCSVSEPNLNCLERLSTTLSPASLKTLKSVTITPLIDWENFDPYANWTHELQQLAGRNVLEVLVIDIDVETNSRCTTDPARWAQLDIVLSGGGFPYLGCVELKVTVWHAAPVDEEFMARLRRIEDQFQWLRESKEVDFSFSLRSEWV